MGCVSSKKDINDIHPNIFQVYNINERGKKLRPGQLEITESDLILHHRGQAPVKWPLRSLRRYGFDSELFSFESGRRCQTGEGVYAFHCDRAERLFNMLQTYIQMRNSSTEDTLSRDFGPATGQVPAPPTRQASTDSNYLEPTPIRQNSASNNNRFSSIFNGPGRICSVSSTNSNGPLSPQGNAGSPSSPPPSLPALVNNNYANEEVFNKAELEKHRTLCHSYSNSVALSSITVPHENAPPLIIQNSSVNSNNNNYSNVNNSNCIDKNTLNNNIIQMTTPSMIVPISPSGSLTNEGNNYTFLDESTFSKIDEEQQPQSPVLSPVYMNVVPGLENIPSEDPPPRPVSKPDNWESPEESRHCYENLEPGEIELLTRSSTIKSCDRVIPHSLSLHNTTSVVQTTQIHSSQAITSPLSHNQLVINYAVLDLDRCTSARSDSNVPPSPLSTTQNTSFVPDSPTKKLMTERYATIDFNRTVALSNSVNPVNAENDTEGCRKTRHNSTIPIEFLSSNTTNFRFSSIHNE